MNEALAALLYRQDGLITRAQALTFISLGALRHRLRGHWQIVLPGVYAAFTGRVSDAQRLRAALLYGGERAQLSDRTVLNLSGVRYLPPDPQTYLMLPASEHRASRDFVEVRRTHRMPAARTIGRFACVPIERALVEAIARIGDRHTGNAIAADAVQRRLADLDALAEEAQHVTGRGSGVVREVVENLRAGGRSAPEIDFLAMCRGRRELPPVLANPLLELPGGELVSPDALLLDAAVVHEVNGRRYHAGEDEFESMQERHDIMTAAGIVLLHNSPRRLHRAPAKVMDEFVATYLRYRGRGLPAGVRLIRREAA